MGQGDHAMAVAADHGFGHDEGIDDGFFRSAKKGSNAKYKYLIGSLQPFR